MGNIHSVKKALESLGAETLVTNKPQDIEQCAKVVLPGVGAFEDAMLELTQRNLPAALSRHIKERKALLGICLGMQLLFESSEESKGTKGLCVLKGKVKKFAEKTRVKVPHIGWNRLKKTSDSCRLLKNIPDNAYVYFCHSYYPLPEAENIIAATTDYGIDFASVIWQDKIYGAQFHPENSQDTGLKILANFINLC